MAETLYAIIQVMPGARADRFIGVTGDPFRGDFADQRYVLLTAAEVRQVRAEKSRVSLAAMLDEDSGEEEVYTDALKARVMQADRYKAVRRLERE